MGDIIIIIIIIVIIIIIIIIIIIFFLFSCLCGMSNLTLITFASEKN